MIRIMEIALPLDQQGEAAEDYLRAQAAKRLKIPAAQIKALTLVKRAVDARKKDRIVFRCTVDVAVEKEQSVFRRARDRKMTIPQPYRYEIPPCGRLAQRPVVVGFGPAGMFAALLLAQAGQCPVVVERGEAVEDRQKQVAAFRFSGMLDPESNVQFGEGGAGTFSDGKLNTGTKDRRARKVLEELHAAGAPAEILYEAHPHVGTDNLPRTVRGIRETIKKLGGTVLFRTRLTAIRTKDGAVIGAVVRGPEGERLLETDKLVLAVGHSARDTYEMLEQMGLAMAQKPFSVGARIEHLQALIDKAQYGAFAGHPALGAAEYKLAVHLPNGRGVYTFCMCPGGEVSAASSEPGMVVTNGMSNFARDGKNANAALLVGIGPEDFGGESPLAGMHLQRMLEQAAFRFGGGDYKAPAQRVEDFLQKRRTVAFGSVKPSYPRGVEMADLNDLFPSFLADSLAEGIRRMGEKLPGFSDPDGVLTAVETRSSAPVRLLRGPEMESVSLRGLYPCGEGAGYAGGIVSAAVDGLKCAESILLDAPRP